VTRSDDGLAFIWDVRAQPIREATRVKGRSIKQWAFRDGEVLVATSDDEHVVRIVRAGDGRELVAMRHPDHVTDVGFGAGDRLVTMAFDGLRLWTLSGRQVAHIPERKWATQGLNLSRNGARVLAIARNHDDATIWDTDTGCVVSTLQPDGFEIWQARLSHDGARAVSTGMDDTARVWDASSGELITVLRGHVGRLSAADFNPDSSRVLTRGFDGTARVWESAAGREILRLRGDESELRCAVFSADGTRIATSADRTVRVWDASTRTIHALRHEDGVGDAMFSARGDRIVTREGRTVRIWDAAGERELGVLQHEHPVSSVQFCADDTRLVTTCRDDSIARLWDIGSQRQVAQMGGIVKVAISPDARSFVTTERDVCRIWSAVDGRALRVLRGGEFVLYTDASFSGDGTRIAAGGGEEARVWDASDGREVAVLKYPRPKAASGRETIIPRGEETSVTTALLSPDGARLVTSCEMHGTLRTWDLASAKLLASMRREDDGSVYQAVLSPDGTQVAAATDNGARLWDVQTGKLIAALDGHRMGVYRCAFSRDGTRVVTASFDGDARVWDTTRGCELALLKGNGQNTPAAAFSPDGKRVITASFDGAARIWDVEDTEQMLGDVAEVLAAALSGGRGVRSQAERGSIPMRSVSESDDDLHEALVLRLDRKKPGAAERVAALAEHLRRSRHALCYRSAAGAPAPVALEARVSPERAAVASAAEVKLTRSDEGRKSRLGAQRWLGRLLFMLLCTSVVAAVVAALAHFRVLPPPP
jgi:WD40 repeat protein